MTWYMFLLIILYGGTIALAVWGYLRRRTRAARLEQQLTVKKEQLQELRTRNTELQRAIAAQKAHEQKLAHVLGQLLPSIQENGLDYIKTSEGQKLTQELKRICQEGQEAGYAADYEALLGIMFTALNS